MLVTLAIKLFEPASVRCKLINKLSYLLIIVLLSLISTVNAHTVINSDISPLENHEQHKLIFGTTNAPHTMLFKQANVILTQAFSELGCQFSLVNLPNKRNLLWANDEKIDGIAFRVNKLEDLYPNLVRVDEALFTIEQWVFSAKDIEVDGWQSLYPYTVAYEQGTLFIEENKDYFLYTIPVISTENAFALVEKQRADLTITSKSTGDFILSHNQDYAKTIKRQTPALVEISLFSYLHEKHRGLAVELAQVLKKMKQSGQYEQLLKQVQ